MLQSNERKKVVLSGKEWIASLDKRKGNQYKVFPSTFEMRDQVILFSKIAFDIKTILPLPSIA